MNEWLAPARPRAHAESVLLAAILDNLQDTYYRTDASGRLLRLSPSIQQLLGYRPDELIGTLAADLYVGGHRCV